MHGMESIVNATVQDFLLWNQ